MPAFDVVSKVDMQEVDNAVNQAIKEIETRYDFRGSRSEIQWDKTNIVIIAEDKMKLSAMQEILKQKAAKRGIGLRALEFKDPEDAFGGSLRQQVDLKQGISQDDAKKISKLIRDEGPKKIQAQIQGDQLRVTGAKRDDLQQVIAYLEARRDGADVEIILVAAAQPPVVGRERPGHDIVRQPE